MKKVILLAPTPPPYGGIAGWVDRMLNTKFKNDWEIVVVDEKVIGNRTVFGEQSKINFFDEIRRCANIWSSLWQELKNEDVKIVQACIPARPTSMMREIFSAILTKIKKKKFIVHFRCTLPNMVKSKLSLTLMKMLFKFCDALFVLNDESRQFANIYYKSKKIYVFPNFVEEESVLDKKNINSKIKEVIYVGGVVPEKGCDQIVRIAKCFPKITFRLIGKIGIDKQMKTQNVILMGEQPKCIVQKYLKEADVFIFLSHYVGEGFSNALLESMALSLPCIVSDWAANADMIDNNKGGVVIESDEELKQALDHMNDPDLRYQMGLWNKNKVINKYSKKIVTDDYVNAYEQLIS